jgi:hypothetical protein
LLKHQRIKQLTYKNKYNEKNTINLWSCVTLAACQQETTVKEKKSVQTYEMTTEIPTGVLTPDKVETSIGTLEYFDGVPTKETSENVYDYLDKMRGVDAFMRGIPGASVRGLILGLEEAGVDDYNKVGITKTLLDSKSHALDSKHLNHLCYSIFKCWKKRSHSYGNSCWYAGCF